MNLGATFARLPTAPRASSDAVAPARSPQEPCQDSPGSSSTRSVPVRNASGGQVMGSTATAFRRRCGSPTWSAV